MEIFYEESNITDMVSVQSCVSTDTCGDRCDSLDIEFQNTAAWSRWAPKEDDKILVSHNGYDTGIMYVNTILQEKNRFRIIGTSLPCKARSVEWNSFYRKTISEIMGICASSAGMESALFGVNEKTVIQYIERRNESCAKFLARLMEMESAVLKCVNGKFTGIGILYAQGLPVRQTIQVGSDYQSATYISDGSAYKSLSIKTAKGEGTASDSLVPASHSQINLSGCLPIANNGQAKRWARGKLIALNRACESIEVESKFNAGYTAMARIDISGNADVAGQWMISEVEHDFINLKSNATLHRCITSVS